MLKEWYMFYNGLFGKFNFDQDLFTCHYKILGLSGNLVIGYGKTVKEAFSFFKEDIDSLLVNGTWAGKEYIDYSFVPEEIKNLPDGIIQINFEMDENLAHWIVYKLIRINHNTSKKVRIADGFTETMKTAAEQALVCYNKLIGE